MSNSTNHYFGVYLEISVFKYKKSFTEYSCSNGHKLSYYEFIKTNFCNICGNPVYIKDIEELVYPTFVSGEILSEEWEDVLVEITPPCLYGSERILCKGNDGNSWLYIQDKLGYPNEQTNFFPNGNEIKHMKKDFIKRYSDIIDALKKSELVKSVEVKAGYVLNGEF